jgi:5-oxoprolinase (ATP-hydrolysing)
MNNFTFGIDGANGFKYYETIAGGSGVSPGWNGTSGVHTNMTNTRITDPESIEQRYPVILRQFSFKNGSRGKGPWNCGEGVICNVELRLPMSASILSERRCLVPYGMEGSSDGKRGRNSWVGRRTGLKTSIGGKNPVHVEQGDRVVI